MTERADSLDQQFALFWAEYPHKVARLKAMAAFRKAIKRGARLADLLAALANQKGLKESLTKAGIWTPSWPYAATWLNGERWMDEQERPPEPIRPASYRGESTYPSVEEAEYIRERCLDVALDKRERGLPLTDAERTLLRLGGDKAQRAAGGRAR